MFNKTERKKKAPYFAIGVGALATIGACSIFRSVKECISNKAERMKSSLKRNKSRGNGETEYTEGESVSEDC